MNTKDCLRILLVAFFIVAGLTACSDDNNDESAQITNYQEYELTVASKQVLGMVFSSGESYFTKVYAVKKNSAQNWESLASIQGFNYEEGYEYHIKISETSYLDYRKGDPSWTEHKLLEVISKKEEESKEIPTNLLPDDYGCIDVELRYIIEADNKDEVEKRLMLMNNGLFSCKQYVFNEGFTKFAMLNEDTEHLVLSAGTLNRETVDDKKFPDSYKLLPLEGQVAATEQWTFLIGYTSDRASLTMDAFTINLPESTGNRGGTRSQIWLYKDMTQYAQTAFPDADVKTVLIVQIIG